MTVASEKYRLETFANLVNFPSITRRQLALAGFIYRDSQCVCSQCGVTIDPVQFDENTTYASDHFRKLHREKISHLGKRCPYLLCELGTNIDDLHPALTSSEEERSLREDAEEPGFIDYPTRLQTFQSWPHAQREHSTFATPAAMATHGFYYSGPSDGVTCFYCGNTLIDWSEAVQSSNENIVQLEHARFFPCRFIIYTGGGKFVNSAGYFHTVSDQERRARNPMTSKPVVQSALPQSIDQCLSTFDDWPEDAPISAKDLANAGFYYLGSNLSVKCYMCDLEVDDWHFGMTVIGTHSRRQYNCPLIQAILSTKTSEIQCVHEKWRLRTLTGLSFGTKCDQRLCRELAACGFYRFKNTDNIRCAYCGVLIQPKSDSSIMFQHRYLAKQLKRTAGPDCLLVRAQCPTNVVIPDRERFPEHPEYQSIFDRIKSFDSYRERYKASEGFIRERAEAGFFLDTMKRMRCFQCGNSLSINDKKLYGKHPQYDIAKLHAHFYPTCEWVKEILGYKYIAQVLLDRTKSNELEYQRSYDPQYSSISAPTTLQSFSSVSAPLSHVDRRFSNDLNISDYSGESEDEEGYETVATPFQAYTSEHLSPTLSPSPSTTPLHEPSPISTAQPCTDIIPVGSQCSLTSPLMLMKGNPFQQFSSPPGSPPIDVTQTDLSPVDPLAFFAHESNRLDSFKKLNRETFAQTKIEELANAGFYLKAEGTTVQCPWCKIELMEAAFERILRRRPPLPGSPLNDEPWTAMRVHRHANGQLTDEAHAWCPCVRRELLGLYPNIAMHPNEMPYPEYAAYALIEKRIRSFDSEWNYPTGSRLSNCMMANAGFIYAGEEKVCCYYCGNRLFKFEPLDCPFEEHARFYPLCNYMIQKRGFAYIERVIKEIPRMPHARQRYEIRGTQKIKYIFFDKSRPENKTQRQPVQRINSRSAAATKRSLSEPSANNADEDQNSCHLCRDNLATYTYAPCQHCPMCGECFAKLTPVEHEECMICRRPATIHSCSSMNVFP